MQGKRRIAPRIYDPFAEYGFNIDTLSLSLVPKGSRVLEPGCAEGRLTSYLRHRLDCFVVSVEINRAQALRARRYANVMVVGDAESTAVQKKIRSYGPYDVVYASGFLAHLVFPERFLRRAKTWIAPHGILVATFPNIAHLTVRRDLFFGKFQYEDSGLLDRTILHFYTIASATQLVEDAGYSVDHFAIEHLGFSRVERLFSFLPGTRLMFRKLYSFFPGLFSYQMVFRLKPRKVG